MFTCQLCGKDFKCIAPSHLKRIHNITQDEYRNQFPGSVLTSDNTKKGYGNGTRGIAKDAAHRAAIGKGIKDFHKGKKEEREKMLKELLGE